MSVPKCPSGQFTVLYFAAATSYTRRSYDFLSAPTTVNAFFNELEKKYPGIKEKVLDSSALTVNLDYVALEEELDKKEGGLILKEGDEVAIVPPVSSG